MLDAEENQRNKTDSFGGKIIDEEEMRRADLEGLCNEASLDIFVQWYSFGGMSHGITLSEVMAMPSWLRKDFRYILSVLGKRRKERESAEEQIKEMERMAKSANRNGRKVKKRRL